MADNRKRNNRDIHEKPFDEGTLAKLALFQDYLRAWLPVFIAAREIHWHKINILDFFAGPGSDSVGTSGSPLIILEALRPYFDLIRTKRLEVNVYLNECNKDKFSQLQSKLKPDDTEEWPFSIRFACEEFASAFVSQLPLLNDPESANFIFLDQTGIKQIQDEIFLQLVNLKVSDFLFFISSSTLKRFPEEENIKQYIKLDPEQARNTPYYQIHRLVLEHYRSLIPKGKEYFLAPFSLKKNAGLYGLIFGSNHPLGMEKFLEAAWKLDKERGEANFDIDDDRILPGQLELETEEVRRPRKVELFEKLLCEKILRQELKNDKDVYRFTISNGFPPIYARGVLNGMIKQGRIKKKRFLLNSDVCKRNAVATQIEVV